MLKALPFVLEQASQRTAAAGGGKDEQSFTNDANGAPCYEHPDGHGMPLWPLFQHFSRGTPAVSRAERLMPDVVSGLGRDVVVGEA